MERRYNESRLPIDPVVLEIHDAISARISGMMDEVAERFQRLMAQELRYALTVEGARASR